MEIMGSLRKADWTSLNNSSANGRFSAETERGNKNKPAPNITGRGLGLNIGGGGDADANKIADESRKDAEVTDFDENALTDGSNNKHRSALMKP